MQIKIHLQDCQERVSLVSCTSGSDHRRRSAHLLVLSAVLRSRAGRTFRQHQAADVVFLALPSSSSPSSASSLFPNLNVASQSTSVRASALLLASLCAAYQQFRHNDGQMVARLGGAWMIPTICLVLFACVIITHARLPKGKAH